MMIETAFMATSVSITGKSVLSVITDQCKAFQDYSVQFYKRSLGFHLHGSHLEN